MELQEIDGRLFEKCSVEASDKMDRAERAAGSCAGFCINSDDHGSVESLAIVEGDFFEIVFRAQSESKVEISEGTSLGKGKIWGVGWLCAG